MRRGGAVKDSAKGIVVLAGESANDRRILASLIKGLHPTLAAEVMLTEITDPVRLRKKTGEELATAANVLVNKARGKARLKKGSLVGVFVHEDMDAPPGPAYDSARRNVSAALARAAGSSESVYALAAAESEAWLLLFPEAFTLYRTSWKLPTSWQGKDTGRRRTPKEDLEAELRSPRFRETDGPEIASKALAHGLLSEPKGTNRSFSEFALDLSAWPVRRSRGC
ncbi:hypothetical protein ACH4ZX_18500 [Streptomyces sp. NPDC020490]|uniref:hypothetical protein n=1 Tax=Streptomyces sp. NPDC020490 TaxID=3365078 RepID=UPI00379FBEBF